MPIRLACPSRRALRRPALALVALALGRRWRPPPCLRPRPPPRRRPRPRRARGRRRSSTARSWAFTYTTGFGPLRVAASTTASTWARRRARRCTRCATARSGTGAPATVGGYSVYLKADDGNTYYYTHLTAVRRVVENTQRTVTAGEVIESVNHTGNANGFNHLHFEIRIGGANGTRVDPTADARRRGLQVSRPATPPAAPGRCPPSAAYRPTGRSTCRPRRGRRARRCECRSSS